MVPPVTTVCSSPVSPSALLPSHQPSRGQITVSAPAPTPCTPWLWRRRGPQSSRWYTACDGAHFAVRNSSFKIIRKSPFHYSKCPDSRANHRIIEMRNMLNRQLSGQTGKHQHARVLYSTVHVHARTLATLLWPGPVPYSTFCGFLLYEAGAAGRWRPAASGRQRTTHSTPSQARLSGHDSYSTCQLDALMHQVPTSTRDIISPAHRVGSQFRMDTR